MRVILTAVNGERLQLDCPDSSPELVGLWLKGHFDEWTRKKLGLGIRMQIEFY